MIHALNPSVMPGKIKILTDWCNDHHYDHYRFLYTASTLSLEGLPHYADPDLTRSLAFWIYRNCPDDRLKFLSVLFVLKALVTVYQPRFIWVSEYDTGCPAVSGADINDLADTCRKDGLAVFELLDVAICRALVEELTGNESADGEEAGLNLPLLVDAADSGKVVGQLLKSEPMEDRVGILLLLLKKMTGNILGICGREH